MKFEVPIQYANAGVRAVDMQIWNSRVVLGQACTFGTPACIGDALMRLYEVIKEMRAAREERNLGTPMLGPRR